MISDSNRWSTAEKAANYAVIPVILYVLVRSFANAGTRALWFDEVDTWIIAQQGSLQSIWNILKHGGDGNPPLYYWIEGLASHLFSSEQFGYRFPSVLGYLCVFCCLFFFIRKRSGSLIALLCATTTLVTSLSGYAAEARPYSLVLACIAFALVCYQRSPSFPWMLMMGLSLMLAETLHYYAFLAAFPFAAAEGVVAWGSGSIRWSVWSALAAVFLPVVGLLPLVSAQKAIYGAHFWARPSLFVTLQSYATFLRMSSTEWGLAVFLLLVLGLVGTMKQRSMSELEKKTAPRIEFDEYALVFAFLALPFVAFIVAKVANGALAPRYILATILGLPIGLSYILTCARRRTFALVVFFLFLTLAYQDMSFWADRLSGGQKFVSPAEPVEKLVASVQYPNLPVMISGQLEYLPIAHYADSSWKRRFFFVLGDQESIANRDEDTAVIQLRILKQYIPLQESESSMLVDEHPQFLLYSHHEIGWDWWPSELQRKGYTLRVLAKDNVGTVFLAGRAPLEGQ